MSRHYRVDPLPERIAVSYADLLFGEDPVITPASEDDGKLVEAIIDGNELPSELHFAEQICASEGETWYRIYTDAEVADVPLIEWHSRLSIIPLWMGRTLKAAALVSILEGPGKRARGNDWIYRHLEIHTEGRVGNVVFRGTKDHIGQPVDLNRHEETEGMAEVWEHDLPGMLCGRVLNKRGRRFRLGRSEYASIEDQLFDLNEAASIGAENARLTAKKRAVVPPSAVTAPTRRDDTLIDAGDGSFRHAPARATFDAGEDVLVANSLDKELGRESDPFKILEYSFDAAALIAYKRDLVETAVTRIGLTLEWLGADQEAHGGADSGVARRMRLIPTTAAAKGKARFWDDALPWVFSLAQGLDAASDQAGGYGRPWKAPSDLPAFERPDPLPTDPVEEDLRHSTNVTSGIESVRTSIEERHPEWDEGRVDEEVDRIRADRQNAGPALPSFG